MRICLRKGTATVNFRGEFDWPPGELAQAETGLRCLFSVALAGSRQLALARVARTGPPCAASGSQAVVLQIHRRGFEA